MRDLSDEAIETLVEQFAAAPSAMSTMVIEHFHGAVCRVGVSDTATPHREPGLKRRYDPDNVFHLNHNISPPG